jgi:hypothetical protein
MNGTVSFGRRHPAAALTLARFSGWGFDFGLRFSLGSAFRENDGPHELPGDVRNEFGVSGLEFEVHHEQHRGLLREGDTTAWPTFFTAAVVPLTMESKIVVSSSSSDQPLGSRPEMG